MNRSGFISVAISYIDWTITIFRFKVIQEVYADIYSRYWSHSRHHTSGAGTNFQQGGQDQPFPAGGLGAL